LTVPEEADVFPITAATTGVLALAMVNSWARKATHHESSEDLRRRLDLSPRLWRTVGFMELLAAIGLAVGLVVAPLGVAAAAGVAAVMVGAITLHLRVDIAGTALVAPFVVLGIAVAAGDLRLLTM
jgi:hypothetical protein